MNPDGYTRRFVLLVLCLLLSAAGMLLWAQSDFTSPQIYADPLIAVLSGLACAVAVVIIPKSRRIGSVVVFILALVPIVLAAGDILTIAYHPTLLLVLSAASGTALLASRQAWSGGRAERLILVMAFVSGLGYVLFVWVSQRGIS